MPDIVSRLTDAVNRPFVIAPGERQDLNADSTFIQGHYDVAVRPGSTDEVAAVVRICAAEGAPIVARGAGTSLVGGPVATAGGVVLSLDRLNQIDLDVANTCAVVGPGVITGDLQREAARHGLMYPPDPGSVNLSTIGGNVACNAGGMRCLKYGVTADYVIGLTVVTADGTVLRLGGKTRKRASGYRLMQLFIGSEGTLGVITEITVKLVPLPRHHATAMVAFDTLEEAGAAVSRIMAAGHLPTAVEIMDRNALRFVAVALPPGFDADHAAILIVEQDGNDEAAVRQELDEVVELLHGIESRTASTAEERAILWEARRSFGRALVAGRMSNVTEDVGVPIAAIPEMIRRFQSAQTDLLIATVGHAGDGNLHPTIFFTEEQRHLVGPVAAQIFRDAIELGGTISAEHGLGALKRDYAEIEHGSEAVALMRQLKSLLDPAGLLNPHKVLPEGPPDDDFLARQPGWPVLAG
jgi:glycolate oxidase